MTLNLSSKNQINKISYCFLLVLYHNNFIKFNYFKLTYKFFVYIKFNIDY